MRAQKPAQGDLMVENVQAVPRLGRRGNIDQRQQNAGDDLQQEQREGGAAEDVPPACGVARHLVQGRVLHRPFELQPALEPVRRRGFAVVASSLAWAVSRCAVEMLTSFAVFESVGIWPASICNWPATIF